MTKKFMLIVPMAALLAGPAMAQFSEADLRKRDLDRPRCSATVTDNCRTWGPNTGGNPSPTEVSAGAENNAVEAGASAAVYRDGLASDPTSNSAAPN